MLTTVLSFPVPTVAVVLLDLCHPLLPGELPVPHRRLPFPRPHWTLRTKREAHIHMAMPPKQTEPRRPLSSGEYLGPMLQSHPAPVTTPSQTSSTMSKQTELS